MRSLPQRSVATALLLLGTLACESSPPTCDEVVAQTSAPTSLDELRQQLTLVRERFYPELQPAAVELVAEDLGEAVFFTASFDFTTLEEPPLERAYIIRANPALFVDPPAPIAVGGILVHEMKHIKDQAEMNATDLAAFGIWYALGDVAEYERQTDEHALAQGCAAGLKAYRLWLYDHISDEAEQQKRVEYFTPEEIDQWVTDHPSESS